MKIHHRRHETGVTQQLADCQQVHACFQHRCRERVTQGVWRCGLVDLRLGHSQLHGFLYRGTRQRHIRRQTREEIVAWLVHLPVLSQLL